MIIQFDNKTYKKFEIYTNISIENGILYGTMHQNSTVSKDCVDIKCDITFDEYEIFIKNYLELINMLDAKVTTIIRTYDDSNYRDTLYYYRDSSHKRGKWFCWKK